jgi:hypothetical protein
VARPPALGARHTRSRRPRRGDASHSAAEADSSVGRYAATDTGQSFPRNWSLPVQLSESEQFDHCGGVHDGRFPLPTGRSMEYRGIEYTVVRDERGDWQWAVSLGNPETIKSGHATSKGAAVLKVWAAIDRTHRKVSLRPRPNVSGNEVPP